MHRLRSRRTTSREHAQPAPLEERPSAARIRTGRLLQLLGLIVAIAGLVGFWLDRRAEVVVRSDAEARLMNPSGAAFQASFVVAGRDFDFYMPAGGVIRNA
ncbi:hypothetical protein BH23DEI1_BH23DEI1_07620 [soil metagenome]